MEWFCCGRISRLQIWYETKDAKADTQRMDVTFRELTNKKNNLLNELAADSE